MSTNLMTAELLAPILASRKIAHRTSGHRHGPITRLFSPGDLGHVVKPFVFLDLIDMVAGKDALFGFHPHSGIVTITTVFEGDTGYEDSTGKSGVLEANGVEWMQAGGGVWHTASPAAPGPVKGYQLWLALPEALENAAPQSKYLAPNEVPSVGPARVVLGSYGGVSSPLPATSDLTYLHVRLRDGEEWTFQPPPGHDVAWLAVDTGALVIGADRVSGEAVVFEAGETAISLRAVGDVNLMIGSAAQHPHDLVMGHYSVHTTHEALAKGEAGIQDVGAKLKRLGKI